MNRSYPSWLATLVTIFLLQSYARAQTFPVTVGLENLGPIGRSTESVTSATGRFIAFQSPAQDLVFGDTTSNVDIFVLDRSSDSLTIASTSALGLQANLDCTEPTISSDGRFLAFQSPASNLVPGDTNGTHDIFVKDLWTGAVTRVSVGLMGSQTLLASNNPCISPDGQFVAFVSFDSSLVPFDTNNQRDYFVHDLHTSTTRRVSVSSLGAEANGPSYPGDISAGGRYVVFASQATNLVLGDSNGLQDVFLHDCLTGETTMVGAGTAASPSISSDGRFVAFWSSAENLVNGDTNDKVDVFLRDRQASQTHIISLTSQNGESNGHSSACSVSDDGRYVAFLSAATNLVSGDTNSLADIFIRDTLQGTTKRINLGPNGEQCNDEVSVPDISGDGSVCCFDTAASTLLIEDVNNFEDVYYYDSVLDRNIRASRARRSGQGNHNSYKPDISQDGRFVAFYGLATNLVKGETVDIRDVYLRDMLLGNTLRVSTGMNSEPGSNHSYSPSVSANGRYVAFESEATNLIVGDLNGRRDIFVRDLATGNNKLVSIGLGGVLANNHSYSPSISSDGRLVAFQSLASNLVPGDTNLKSDIFVHDLQQGTTIRVSVSTAGAQTINADSDQPTISGNGRFVAFRSFAYNLVQSDTNNRTDVFMRDLLLGITSRVSLSYLGVQGSGDSQMPTLSDDGRLVAFTSIAPDLIPGDSTLGDVFVRDNISQVIISVSRSSNGSLGDGGSYEPALSGDARFVAFRSNSSNLIPGDTNAKDDVFVHDLSNGQRTLISLAPDGIPANDHSDSPVVSRDGQFVAFCSRARLTAMPKLLGTSDIYLHARNGYRPSVSGIALLNGFLGVTWGEPLEVQIWSGNEVVETLDGNYGPDGSFLFVPGPAASGHVTLKFRFHTSLWRALQIDLNATSVIDIRVELKNGDCDGDNEVNIGDYAIMSASYASSPGDTNWHPTADLNGDDVVDIADYAILSTNFGEGGD